MTKVAAPDVLPIDWSARSSFAVVYAYCVHCDRGHVEGDGPVSAAAVPVVADEGVAEISLPVVAAVGVGIVVVAGIAAAVQAPGSRPGKDFTPAGKRTIWDESGVNGRHFCANCGIELIKPQKSEMGVTPPSNEGQVDHIEPKSKGISGDPSNGQLLCRACNREKSDK